MLMKVGAQVRSMTNEAPVRSRGHLRPVEDLDATLPLGQTARLRPAPEVLPMKCLRCQGPVEQGTAPVCLDREGYRLAWEQVPAWVCTRCDLAYFEPGAVETVCRALRALRSMKSQKAAREA
jgi:hypothetical protein